MNKRQLALAWWSKLNNLVGYSQKNLIIKHLPTRFGEPTGREIQYIWEQEGILEQQAELWWEGLSEGNKEKLFDSMGWNKRTVPYAEVADKLLCFDWVLSVMPKNI